MYSRLHSHELIIQALFVCSDFYKHVRQLYTHLQAFLKPHFCPLYQGAVGASCSGGCSTPVSTLACLVKQDVVHHVKDRQVAVPQVRSVLTVST
jgi:hypothetical protein